MKIEAEYIGGVAKSVKESSNYFWALIMVYFYISTCEQTTLCEQTRIYNKYKDNNITLFTASEAICASEFRTVKSISQTPVQ